MRTLLVAALLAAPLHATSVKLPDPCNEKLLAAPSEAFVEDVNEAARQGVFTKEELKLLALKGLKFHDEFGFQLDGGAVPEPKELAAALKPVCAARRQADAAELEQDRASLAQDLANARKRLDETGVPPSASLMGLLHDEYARLHAGDPDSDRAAGTAKSYRILSAHYVAHLRSAGKQDKLSEVLAAYARKSGEGKEFEAAVAKAAEQQETRRRLQKPVPKKAPGDAAKQLEKEAKKEPDPESALTAACQAECDGYHKQCDGPLAKLKKCLEDKKANCDLYATSTQVCQKHLMLLRDDGCVCP